MFNNLLESRAVKQKSLGAQIFSAILHGAIIVVAVIATANAGTKNEKPKAEDVKFVDTPKDEPKPEDPKPPPPDVVVAPPPPKGFTVLTAPIEIPDVIPDVDLTKKVISADDFSGKGVAGGSSKGVVGGTGPVGDQPYFEFQVEKPAMAAPGSTSPRYPDILRSAGVEGEALVQFVVDTTGRAEMNTFKVLKATHELFGAAVKNALPNMRFLPAEVGGKHVKQLVQQPFVFAIQK
jgi:protein TonB